MRLPRLGKVQLRIMRVLWRRGRATAREITEDLNRDQAAIAHSTVQTLLRELEAKETVGHVVEGRTFLYYARCEQDEVTVSATRDLISRLFDGSALGLVAHLLKSEPLTPEDLDRLKRIIEEKER